MIPPDPYAGQMISSVPEPAWLGVSAVSGVFAMKAFDWWLNRRTARAQAAQDIAVSDAATSLIEHLNSRIVALEGRQALLEQRLNEETVARFTAEETVSRLRRRIAVLIGVMKHHKIEVPEDSE